MTQLKNLMVEEEDFEEGGFYEFETGNPKFEKIGGQLEKFFNDTRGNKFVVLTNVMGAYPTQSTVIDVRDILSWRKLKKKMGAN